MQITPSTDSIKSKKRPTKANRHLETSTTEILDDIATRLRDSDDEIQNVIANPDSLFDTETYKKYEKFIGQTVQLPIPRISLTNNIRHSIDVEADDFQKLVSDIARNGIQQNVIVELVQNEKGGQLICVAGHRRITAALLAGNVTHVHALIRQFKQKAERTQSALAENLLRKDLHSLDIADGYHQLIDEGWTKDDLAEVFERNEKTIRYYLKMAKWPQEVKEVIRNNQDKFPARVLINTFAAKRFPTDSSLLKAVTAILTKSENTKDRKNMVKKETLTSQLERILDERKIDAKTRIVIRDVFRELGLVRYE